MSYDLAKLKKCGDFCALTWLIFADLLTYVKVKICGLSQLGCVMFSLSNHLVNKTTLGPKILPVILIPRVVTLTRFCVAKFILMPQVLNAEQNERARRNEYNFDHPGMFAI